MGISYAGVMGRPRIPLEQRFEMHSRWDGDCRIWTGALTPDGYGIIRVDKKNRGVHRVAYEFYVGPIPEGLTLDHVKAWGCKSRACFNPEHLEPVTIGDNIRRGDTGKRPPSTHCSVGHLLEGNNLRIDSRGARICRTCQRDYMAAREWRRTQARRAAGRTQVRRGKNDGRDRSDS